MAGLSLLGSLGYLHEEVGVTQHQHLQDRLTIALFKTMKQTDIGGCYVTPIILPRIP